MRSSLNQEVYKFKRMKAPLFGIVALLLLMIYTAVMEGINQKTIVLGFGMGQWISIIISVIASMIFGMEYQNNTILTVFYKNPTKIKTYFSKLLLLGLYSLLLVTIDIIFSFLIKIMFASSKYSWFEKFYNNQTLLSSFVKVTCGSIGMIFLMTVLVICLICYIHVTSVAISIGLILVFLSQAISGSLMSIFGNILKWNPLNMFNLLSQLLDSKFISISKISVSEMIISMVIYIISFSYIGYLFFKSRRI